MTYSVASRSILLAKADRECVSMSKWWWFTACIAVTAVGCSSSDDTKPGAADAGTGGSTSDGSAADATGSGGNFGQLDGGEDSGQVGLPPGKFACNADGKYRCTHPGEECCTSKDLCYYPASEPDFCP